jgi:hypothetical protein
LNARHKEKLNLIFSKEPWRAALSSASNDRLDRVRAESEARPGRAEHGFRSERREQGASRKGRKPVFRLDPEKTDDEQLEPAEV